MTSFREVVARALHDHYCEGDSSEPCLGKELDIRSWSPISNSLAEGLKAAGYSIHRSGECVHPRTRRADLGREMTDEELKIVRK